MTTSQFQHNVSGWYKDRVDHRDHALPLSTMALPARVSLVKTCPDIEDQGPLGSCTANAATSAMEMLYRKLGKPNPDLSRLFLYFTTRVFIEGSTPGDDTGASIRDTMKACARYGVCFDKSWPYDVSRFGVRPGTAAFAEAVQNQLLRYYACPTLVSVKASIAGGFPVVCGFSVPENMMSVACARTGIVGYPTARESIVGGHAIMLMGYNDVTQRLMFQNSWGASWGDRGFGYLPYSFFIDLGNGALAGDCWSPRVEEMLA